jgi:hypothetical protein
MDTKPKNENCLTESEQEKIVDLVKRTLESAIADLQWFSARERKLMLVMAVGGASLFAHSQRLSIASTCLDRVAREAWPTYIKDLYFAPSTFAANDLIWSDDDGR